MKEIYIMLTQMGTLVSRAIKLYTKAKYNHASIGIDPSMRVFYSFARRIRYFPLIGGFITEIVDEGLFLKYCECECIVYSIQVNDDVYRRFLRILNRYRRNPMRYKYNLLGFFGVIFNIPYSCETRNTCAEFVARMLHESGIFSFDKSLSLVRPHELQQIPKLRVVYEGKIKNLQRPIAKIS